MFVVLEIDDFVLGWDNIVRSGGFVQTTVVLRQFGKRRFNIYCILSNNTKKIIMLDSKCSETQWGRGVCGCVYLTCTPMGVIICLTSKSSSWRIPYRYLWDIVKLRKEWVHFVWQKPTRTYTIALNVTKAATGFAERWELLVKYAHSRDLTSLLYVIRYIREGE